MTGCGRWACTVPQVGFVLAQSPRAHSKSQENMGKRSKSAQVCSVPGEVVSPAPFVPMLLWRVQSAGGLPWTRTSSDCRGVDLTPWCPVSPRWLPCHTASICSALTTILLPAQLSTPMSTSHLLSWCLGQQIHHDHRTAMQLYCAVFWWERWLLVQLGNESLEGPPLNPSLGCNSAHPSPGFMNLCAVQLLSSLLQNSTEIEQYLLLPAAQTSGTREPVKSMCCSMEYLKMFLKYWLSLILFVDFSFSKKSYCENQTSHLGQEGEYGRGIKCNYLQCNWAGFTQRVTEATKNEE